MEDGIVSEEDKLILGTLAGVDLVLSPEHYEEYKGTLNKQLEQKDKEIDRLNNIINELKKYLIEMSDKSWNDNGAYDDILDKLKELKDNNK
jgi:hypothetical protein